MLGVLTFFIRVEGLASLPTASLYAVSAKISEITIPKYYHRF